MLQGSPSHSGIKFKRVLMTFKILNKPEACFSHDTVQSWNSGEMLNFNWRPPSVGFLTSFHPLFPQNYKSSDFQGNWKSMICYVKSVNIFLLKNVSFYA